MKSLIPRLLHGRRSLVLIVLISLISAGLKAQTLPPIAHTNDPHVLTDRKVQFREFLLLPRSTASAPPANVPDSLKDGSIRYNTTLKRIQRYNLSTHAYETAEADSSFMDVNFFRGSGISRLDPFTLRDSIRLKYAVFDRGVHIGSGTDTARSYYVVSRKVGADSIRGRVAVTGAGSGGVIIYANGTSRTPGLDVRIDRNWPNYLPDNGHEYQVLTSFGLPDTTGVDTIIVKVGDLFYKQKLTVGGGTSTNSDSLNHQAAAYYLNRANHTGTQAESTIVNLVTDLAGKVPATRTITINGTTLDLSADRSWTVGSSVTPVSGEAPTGTINGANATFTAAHTPISGSISVFINGIMERPTTDWTISGATLTMIDIPQTGDNLLINYQY